MIGIKRYDNCFAAASYNVAAILISILFTILFIITPPAVDDLLFMSDVRDLPNLFDRFRALPDMLLHRWETETGRFGNFIAIPAIWLLPRYVIHILSGAVIYLILRLLPRAAGVQPGSFISSLLLTVFIFLFPWYDSLFQISYSINYIWGALFALLAILILIPRAYGYESISEDKKGDKKEDKTAELIPSLKIFSSRHTTLCCIICFFAGWTHEVFGAPLCAGTFFLYIISRPKSIKQVLPFISLIFGTALTFTSPMFWQRLLGNGNPGEGLKIMQFPLSELLIQLGPAMLMFAVFLIALFITFLFNRKNIKSLPEIKTAIFFTAASLTALAIFLIFYTGARTGTSLLLFSATGTAFLFNLFPTKASKDLSITVLSIISAASIVNLYVAILSESKLRKEYYEIERLYSESPTGEIYFDLTYPEPDLSLFKTGVFHFHQRIPLWMWTTYYGHDAPLTILPKALEGFSPAKARISTQSTGNNPRAWIYNGCIVISPEEGEYLNEKTITSLPFEIIESQKNSKAADNGNENITGTGITGAGVTNADVTSAGKIKESRFRLSEFTGADGYHYLYIEPHIKVLDNSIQLQDILLP